MENKKEGLNREYNWINRHPIATICIIIFVFITVASSFSNDNSTTSTTTTNTQTTQSTCTSDITSLQNTATTIDFKQLNKNPDSFTGQTVMFTGKIVQIQESNGEGMIRLSVTKDSYDWSFSDIIYIDYQGHNDSVQDDVVTVYGVINGSHTYKSVASYNITIPGMTACSIIKGYPKSKIKSTIQNLKTDITPTMTPAKMPITDTKIPLTVSCVASQSPVDINQKVTWTTQVTGGNGQYSYIWTGSDNLSGNNSSTDINYQTSGEKNASIKVISGDQSVNQNCINTVMVGLPKSWHIVKTFSGNDNKINTEPFTIQGSQWKIVWSANADTNDSYCTTYGCLFSVQIFDTSDNLQQDYITKDNITSSATDVSNYYTSGTYYLKVSGSSMNSWNISVQDYY